jgi:hypothetical protein
MRRHIAVAPVLRFPHADWTTRNVGVARDHAASVLVQKFAGFCARKVITHDEVHRYSRTLAERIAATDHGRYTVSASMAQRLSRLFIDYLRNGRGTTAVGTWSPRGAAGLSHRCARNRETGRGGH